jgi:hypothetical protein
MQTIAIGTSAPFEEESQIVAIYNLRKAAPPSRLSQCELAIEKDHRMR